LLPALSIVGQDSYEADYIQVYYRLAHHLDPMQFSFWAWFGYAGLLLFWNGCTLLRSRSEAERWFTWFVLATMLIALAGLAVGYRHGPPGHLSHLDLRMKILKLYPFRLCDAMIPFAASLAAVGLLARRQGRATQSWGVFGGAMVVALLLPSPDRNASRMEPDRLANWIDACRWISGHTPADALVLTPTQESWAFKWYGERAEFVSHKDCPQDAAGIVEWNNRLLAIREWAQRTYDGEYSADELRELRDKFGITHILAGRLGPMGIDPVYQNESFRVYSLREIPPAATNAGTTP
jgi:hypothetical protein